jgi:hypothetical protein
MELSLTSSVFKKLTALPKYIPSSSFIRGKPIGFQRCVKPARISAKEIKIID